MTYKDNEHPEWTDRLSDFLDGGLDPETHAAFEAHLGECGSCRGVLEGLDEVRRRAAALGPIEPTRDLWAGIAATIRAPAAGAAEGATVIALPTAERARPDIGSRRSHRVSLSSMQLVAASLVLVVGSSLATLTLRSQSPTSTPPVAATGSEGVIMPAGTAAPPPADLALELSSLEQALAEARGVLDPNTVRILERNLSVIEQAIEDSHRALMQDPENAFLAEHLDRVYHRKLEYLREAARVVESAD
ncbi:MAG: zf-HC2 domain-containing protein [Gemmatimonadota bacterium]|nr:zf-HC2 domain-containing protein [Gemmatimonadota bacterium]